jgi:Na+/glutamate symporter
VGFGRALAVGVLIGVVASCCYVLTWEFIYFGMKSDYIEKYQAHMIDKARQAGESPASIAAKQAEMAKYAQMYHNPIINSAMTFIEPMPVALVMALVSAGVVSRRKKAAPGPSTA